jgi:hypothetical protein
MIPRLLLITTSFAAALMLGGCDLEALLADPRAVQKAADAKAIGSACRYGKRGIEDCYALNEKSAKSGIFEGWKEMDTYMRENNIEGIEAKIAPKPAASALVPEDEMITETKSAEADAVPAKKPDTKK